MENSVHTKIDNSTHNTINIGSGSNNKFENISISSSCNLKSKEKLKVFISMPMDGKTKSEIDEYTQQAIADIHQFIAEIGYKGKKDYDIEAFSGYVELEENPNILNSALNYMGASLQKMAEAAVVWACAGWTEARGCVLEIKAASAYGIDTFLCFALGERMFEDDRDYYAWLNSKGEPLRVQIVRNFTDKEEVL